MREDEAGCWWSWCDMTDEPRQEAYRLALNALLATGDLVDEELARIVVDAVWDHLNESGDDERYETIPEVVQALATPGAVHELIQQKGVAEARARELEAEVERHRKANLLRAVLEGWEDRDDFITEAINSKSFDNVPWRVAESFKNDLQAERALADELASIVEWNVSPGDPPGPSSEVLARWRAAREGAQGEEGPQHIHDSRADLQARIKTWGGEDGDS